MIHIVVYKYKSSHFAEPKFHPPTANNVFKSGFLNNHTEISRRLCLVLKSTVPECPGSEAHFSLSALKDL